MNQKQRIKELEDLVVRLIKERDIALKRLHELEEENIRLQKKLIFYEGPHVPPSHETIKKKKKELKQTVTKKRGAPKGHKGATRKVSLPDEIIDVLASLCPNCHKDPGESVETVEKTVEDIVPPREIKTKVIKYYLHKHICQHCGYEFMTKHERCPQVGIFGPSLLVYITMLKYHLRGVIRRIQDFLLYCSNFDITPKGILDVLNRVGISCKNEYERIVLRIRAAEWRYIDETSFKVNGKKHWLWVFRSNEGDVLVVIRNTRSRNVVDEVLGKDHSGPDVVDGWKAYSHIKNIQRCWSHLIREVDDYNEISDNGRQLSDEIHMMYRELMEFLNKGPPMEERISMKIKFDTGINNLAEKYSTDKELQEPLTYIRNGLGKWYTCLLYPGMEPTNNLGEQAIREHVIMRKIIGCFRSENGSQNYQYIASLLSSWRLQGKNMFEELEKLLVRELCLS